MNAGRGGRTCCCAWRNPAIWAPGPTRRPTPSWPRKRGPERFSSSACTASCWPGSRAAPPSGCTWSSRYRASSRRASASMTSGPTTAWSGAGWRKSSPPRRIRAPTPTRCRTATPAAGGASATRGATPTTTCAWWRASGPCTWRSWRPRACAPCGSSPSPRGRWPASPSAAARRLSPGPTGRPGSSWRAARRASPATASCPWSRGGAFSGCRSRTPATCSSTSRRTPSSGRAAWSTCSAWPSPARLRRRAGPGSTAAPGRWTAARSARPWSSSWTSSWSAGPRTRACTSTTSRRTSPPR
jgi:hypothetical protein